MSDLEFAVLRPEDLLTVGVSADNLIISQGADGQPALTRIRAGEPAFLAIELPPQHIAELVIGTLAGDASSDPPPDSPIASVISEPTRLVFRLPDALTEIPLTVPSLLDWSRLEAALPANALPDPPAALENRPGVALPGLRETAIELPYGLVLAPDRTSGWSHMAAPVTRAGWTELWHTRLSKIGDPSSARTLPIALRAVSSAHQNEDYTPLLVSPSIPTSLTKEQRAAIARASADFTRPEQPPLPIRAKQLILSALGAWADLHGQWEIPEILGWDHLVRMGRDQHVRVQTAGYLFPFGHRAVTVAITDRSFVPTAGGEAPAYLARKTFLTVVGPVRELDVPDLPFTQVRIDTVGPIAIDDPPPNEAFMPMQQREPVRFACVATDKDGAPVVLDMPMVYAPDNKVGDLPNLMGLFAKFNRIDLRTQSVAFIRSGTARTPLNTHNIELTHRAADAVPPFMPRMVQALVDIPELRQIDPGGSPSTAIRYSERFLAGNAAEGIYADLMTSVPIKFEARDAGGIAAPAMTMSGLSSTRGVVANAAAISAAQPPDVLDGLDGRLLGVIELKQFVAAIASVEHMPLLKTEIVDGRLRTAFSWTTPAQTQPHDIPASGSATWKVDGNTALTLSGTRESDPDGTKAHSRVCGELKEITLNLPEVARVTFKRISFVSETASDTSFDIEVGDFSFQGDLAFVDDLAKQLKSIPLVRDSGAYVNLSPAGVTVGIAVALPPFKFGALQIVNARLGASVQIGFVGDLPVELRFTLASREDPFLVTYSLLGGGGHFDLTAHSDKTVTVDASIAVAAVADIDLVLARGVAEVRLGIIFTAHEGNVSIGASLRIFGSLEVLKLVTVSVCLDVDLVYQRPLLVAHAKLTIMVHVLAWSEGVCLEVKRSFDPEHPTSILSATIGDSSARPMLEEEEWNRYCGAFAPAA